VSRLRSKKVLMIAVPLLAAVIGLGLYKTVLAKPAKPEPKPKVEGQVYVLPKEFLVNLADDRFAKLSVSLVLPHDEPIAPEAGGHGAAKPPEGFGTLPQEAVVRDIVTDMLTNASADQLIEREPRHKLKEQMAKTIKKNTDVHVEDVLLTDVAVQ
jgi:flagellar FliL protein